MKHLKRTLALLALVLASAGCGPKEFKFQVKIVTTSCDAKVDPFKDVGFLKVIVTGDGLMKPIEATSSTGATSKEIRIPDIPAGKNRVVEVRGYKTDPAGGDTNVLSMGRSAPFEVLSVIPDTFTGEPTLITVFLRRTNAFTPVASAANPGECGKLRLPRAGHSATLLKDGKVFIAGGYNLKAGSPEKLAISDAEIFNPATGAFEAAAELAVSPTIKVPKAFHTATALKNGDVLLWGGEAYTGGSNNVVAPSTLVLIYRAAQNFFQVAKMRASPMSIARTQHRAAIDASGKVLVVGGKVKNTMSTTPPLVPSPDVEWFDPDTNEISVVTGVSLPRLDSSLTAVQNGTFIAVAGGSDGTALQNDVVFFKFDGSSFAKQAGTRRLADPGRRSAGVATLRDSTDLVLLGGYSDPVNTTPVASTEIVATGSTSVAQGPAVATRGDICAVTMRDGRVLAIGGRGLDQASKAKSDGSTEVITADGAGGAQSVGGPTLVTPRYFHTCTSLADGTVLVTGGVNESIETGAEILSDALIFQPGPIAK